MPKRTIIKTPIVIEVGGDHGDGNVEVVKKPKGVTLIIKDWDNATWDGEADNDPIPEVRRYEEDEEIKE